MSPLLLAFGVLAIAAQPQERSRDLILARSDAPAGLPIYSGSHLLIVGIDKYQNLPASTQLRYAVNDAKVFRQVLQDFYGFQARDVRLLTNDQASLANIRKALDELADPSRVKADDRVLVYFSGHGQSVKDSGGVERGYLVPFDAKVSLEKPVASEFAATCLPMQEVWDRLDPSPAKHIAVLADSCFSGMLTKSRGFEGYGLSAYLTMPARQAITAGGSGQKTWESDEYKHGVFTYSLLEELKRRAKEKQQVFPIVELFASVLDPVVRLSKGRQTPQYNPFFTEGQMLFFAAGDQKPADVPEVRPQSFTGKLSIKTNPSGADVWIDGEPAGKSPLTKEYTLAEKMQVRIRLELEGYEPLERSLEVKPKGEAKVDHRMVKLRVVPKEARLEVDSDPSGATVSVDGAVVGKTPLTLTRKITEPQPVTVKVSMEGYEPAEDRATFDSAKPGKLTLTMKKVHVEPVSPILMTTVCTISTPGPAEEVAFSPDGSQVAVYGEDGGISIFDVPSGRLVRTVSKPKDTFMRVTQDWKSLAFVTLMSDGKKNWASLLMQDLKNDASGKVLAAGMPQCTQMNHTWSDGQSAIVCGQSAEGAGVVTFLDMRTGATKSFSAPGRFTAAVASPDGETMAVFRDARRSDVAVNLILMRGKDKTDQQQISIPDSDFGERLFLEEGVIAINSGRRLSASSVLSKGLRVFDTKSGDLRFALPGHHAVGFLDGGQRLAAWTSTAGGQIEVFDARSGTSLGRTASPRPWLSQDGRLAASIAPNRSIIISSLRLQP